MSGHLAQCTRYEFWGEHAPAPASWWVEAAAS